LDFVAFQWGVQVLDLPSTYKHHAWAQLASFTSRASSIEYLSSQAISYASFVRLALEYKFKPYGLAYSPAIAITGSAFHARTRTVHRSQTSSLRRHERASCDWMERELASQEEDITHFLPDCQLKSSCLGACPPKPASCCILYRGPFATWQFLQLTITSVSLFEGQLESSLKNRPSWPFLDYTHRGLFTLRRDYCILSSCSLDSSTISPTLGRTRPARSDTSFAFWDYIAPVSARTSKMSGRLVVASVQQRPLWMSGRRPMCTWTAEKVDWRVRLAPYTELRSCLTQSQLCNTLSSTT